jgi:hypothetical protein
MKPTKKFTYNGFGLIALSVVFLLLYAYFTAADNHLIKVNPVPVNNQSGMDTVGALGGFHLLESIQCSDEQTYYRLTLQTRLNRSTVIDKAIAVPLTKVTQVDGSELRISLNDTSIIDQINGKQEVVFMGDKTLVIDQLPITTIKLIDSPDGTVNQISVGLSSEVKFKVSSTPTGAIYIDILK